MIWLVAGATLTPMLIAWAAGFLVRRLAPRWGLVDRPDDRKAHATPTPLGGGLAIWLGVAVTFLLLQIAVTLASPDSAASRLRNPSLESTSPAQLVQTHAPGAREQSPKLWTILAAGTVLLVLGLIDDKRGLDWRTRLSIQTAIAVVMVWQGWRLSLFIDVPWFTSAVSVFWIVGLINSFNMLDNMDGLSAGVAAIAAAMLAAVMLITPGQPQLFVGGFLLVLCGGLLGFLWHNRPPARLYMGDAGSYFVGFMIAIATLMATFVGENVPRHAILAPLCVLAVPIYDTLTVIVIRLGDGRSPFVADRRHFSHRLVELGLTQRHAVWTIYLATATCGLGALLLHQVNTAGAAVILLLVTCTLAIVAILETAGRKR